MNASDDIVASLGAIKNTVPIGKTALLSRQLNILHGSQIECSNQANRLRHFLPIRTYILNRRAADGPRNPCKAFDTGIVLTYGKGHKSIPVLARSHRKNCRFARSLLLDALQGNSQHNARKASITDQQITSSAQNE